MLPYNHLQEDVIEPFVTALSKNVRNQIAFKQFKQLIDTIQASLIDGKTEGDHAHITPDGEDAEDVQGTFKRIVKQCETSPGDVGLETISAGVAIAIRESKQDILGTMYQSMGCNSDHSNGQYFTPPNVSRALGDINAAAHDNFDRPEIDTNVVVTEKATLSAFGQTGDDDADSGETTSNGLSIPNRGPEDAEMRTIFDPACGSGRLGLGVAHSVSADGKTPVLVGWELQQTAALMAAITLSLQGGNGYIVQGNAVRMEPYHLYRVNQSDEAYLTEYRLTDRHRNKVPSETNSDIDSGDVLGMLNAEQPSDGEGAINELVAILEYGFDHGITNPPFERMRIEDINRARDQLSGGREAGDYEVATKDYNSGELRNAQMPPWLFAELLGDYVKEEGTATVICSRTLTANISQKDERNWFMNRCGIIESTIDLPETTFAPATKTRTSVITFMPRTEKEAKADVDPEHQVQMYEVKSVGHDATGDPVVFTPDGDASPRTVKVESLSDEPYHTLTRWLADAGEEITVPDDELQTLRRNHRSQDAPDKTGDGDSRGSTASVASPQTAASAENGERALNEENFDIERLRIIEN